MSAVAPENWQVRIDAHHPGDLPLAKFDANQPRLRHNRTNPVLSGAAREGAALLQGLLLCGHCGRRLSVRSAPGAGRRRSGRARGPMVALPPRRSRPRLWLCRAPPLLPACSFSGTPTQIRVRGTWPRRVRRRGRGMRRRPRWATHRVARNSLRPSGRRSRREGCGPKSHESPRATGLGYLPAHAVPPRPTARRHFEDTRPSRRNAARSAHSRQGEAHP